MARNGAIVSLSGGIDSTTLLGLLLHEEKEVLPVSFNYPSKHNKHELWAARKIVEHYDLLDRWFVFDLTSVFRGFTSNLLNDQGEIPEGHYTDPSMKRTVVPGRNLIFLSILSGLAESREIEEVVIGIHSGDHPIYPDCRPVFFESALQTVFHSSDGRVCLRAPFLWYDKADILSDAIHLLDIPLHLTRTCYKDQPNPCGKCGSCVERAEAFRKVRIPDPCAPPSLEFVDEDPLDPRCSPGYQDPENEEGV